jgi:urease beta subunit
MIPGETVPTGAPVEINAGLPVTVVPVTNTGPVPIHLTAHFHIFEANPRLSFDRRKAYGMRLDLPSNGNVRIEPGATVELRLVPIGGRRVVYGFNGAVDGDLEEVGVEEALRRLVARGFLHVDSSGKITG